MSREFRDLVQLILNGEDIASEVVNRPLRQLGGNAEYLFNQFELARKGGTVFARGQSIDDNCKVGQPIYYNSQKGVWDRARAAASINAQGAIEVAASGQAWGVIYCKLGSTKADILLAGTAELDISAAVAGEVNPGQYYLSATMPGKLSSASPPVSIPILQVAGLGQKPGTHVVNVNTNFNEVTGTHEHFDYELLSEPAGIANYIAAAWVVTGPDENLEGWLPADHAVFNGEAPAGAEFGYNIGVTPLAGLWPPVPIDSAYAVWQQGSLATDLGMGTGGLIVFTDCGIWWMSNCKDEVPWPPSVTTTSTTTTSTTTSTSTTSTSTTSTTTTTPPP